MVKQRTFAPHIPLPAYSNSAPDAKDDPATPQAELSIAAGRNLQNIPVGLIDRNPLAPRTIYTAAMIQERAEALRTQGQHDPIHVTPNTDAPGRFIICDGWTRVLACVQHQVLPELLAEVHADLSPVESSWFGYQQNEERSQHCDLDRGMYYEKLIAGGMKPSELARRTKLSAAQVSYFRSYSKLPEDVLEIIQADPNKFGSLVAANLFKLYDKCGLRKTVALAGKFAAEDQTVRWLVNQVQTQINPSAHKAGVPLKHIRYSNGYFKQRGDGFEVSISVPADKREAFAAALEELLGTVAEQVEADPAQGSSNE